MEDGSRDGTRIQVDIYRGEDDLGWIQEVIDKENASTVWNETFDTDREALDIVTEVIELDGIRSFLESDPGVDALSRASSDRGRPVRSDRGRPGEPFSSRSYVTAPPPRRYGKIPTIQLNQPLDPKHHV